MSNLLIYHDNDTTLQEAAIIAKHLNFEHFISFYGYYDMEGINEANINSYMLGLDNKNKCRKIFFGRSGGHGNRIKVSAIGGDFTGPYISLSLDDEKHGGIIKNDGDNPKKIKMDPDEYNFYCDFCRYNWGLLMYMYTHTGQDNLAQTAIVSDHIHRIDPNVKGLNATISRDKNTGDIEYVVLGSDWKYHMIKEDIKGNTIDLGIIKK